MKAPFIWDSHSDQPYQLKDRAYKKRSRRANLRSLIKTVLIALFALPLSTLLIPFVRPRRVDTQAFFGMGADPLRESEATLEMLERLHIRQVLIRFGLWQMERLEEVAAFCARLEGSELSITIMQDREHIEDEALLRRDVETLFARLSPYARRFVVGNAINRAKWGLFGVDEYLRFARTVHSVRDAHFAGLELVGGSVIDFEYHATAHALLSPSAPRYDAVSALLYVDRRGAPENSQLGFSLQGKILLQRALMMLARRNVALYITEANWPISHTAPYAPTSEHECVSEAAYARYMVRYHLIALGTGGVNTVFWHQLIAPGYGLVDSRDGLRERSAFEAYRVMVSQLQGMRVVAFKTCKRRFELRCESASHTLRILWAFESYTPVLEADEQAYDLLGGPLKALHVYKDPIYIRKERR
ncbi:MAG: glycosyl hydrolase [Campylobacterales bacterium]|nr:glycosyl hydrolase [Campylobacterales bacterium]